VRIVFDVDGTLLRSTTIDAELYARAFVETFGVALPTTDWSRYRHATDRGIAEEAVALVGGDVVRIDALRARFVALLADVAHIDETPGAGALVRSLRVRGVALAIATGGWEAAAREKLRAGAIDVGAIPLVGSDEHVAREDILRAAIARAGGDGPVFYVGDGPWDQQACRAVGIELIAVGEGARALSRRWVRDFTDAEAWAHALADAAP
jgi:phosphoglycolate phosphatase-like HAD superfamily hydrolase